MSRWGVAVASRPPIELKARTQEHGGLEATATID